jgi:hypothetical protein
MSEIKYDGGDMLFDTPFLKVVKNNFYDEGSFFTISFALLNNKSCKNFFKTIYDIEEYNCIMIQQESENWFGKKIPLNVLYKKHIQPWEINRNGDIVITFKVAYDNDNMEDFRNLQVDDVISLRLHYKNLSIYQSNFFSNWMLLTFKNEDEDNIDFYTVEEPVSETVEQVNETVEPVNEDVVEPVNETVEHVNEEVIEPVSEAVEESVNEEVEKVDEEVVEPVNETVEKSVNEEVEELDLTTNPIDDQINNLVDEAIEKVMNEKPIKENTKMVVYDSKAKKKKKIKYRKNLKTDKIYRRKRVLIKIPKQ